jgi:hypothetical protein
MSDDLPPPRRYPRSTFDYFSAEPGSYCLRVRSASTPAGVTLAMADSILFCQPATTSPSPFIIALKPVSATSAGLSFSAWPIFVSCKPARSKNSVSVANVLSEKVWKFRTGVRDECFNSAWRQLFPRHAPDPQDSRKMSSARNPELIGKEPLQALALAGSTPTNRVRCEYRNKTRRSVFRLGKTETEGHPP